MTPIPFTEILSLTKKHSDRLIAFRRHLHAHPELSYKEFKTSAFIQNALSEAGIRFTAGIAETGILAEVSGRNEGKTVALRGDMDALPIQEENQCGYRSVNAGIMHACGHDVHTASLLGTAKILTQLKEHFEGTIRLIFQPGEEKNPGGASYMIRDGALQNPEPASIIGQHVFPLLPVGKIGFREGMYMASCDELYLTVKGKGGHGAAPELTVDPVLIASHIVIALQQVISRNASPKQPTVLTIGKIEGGTATNIIPNEVKLTGTFRAMDEGWREEALKKIKRIAEGLAESMGGTCDVEISRGYPFLKNDPSVTQRIKEAAKAYVGADNVVDIDISLGAEDFSYYSQVIPASFYRLGTKNEAKGITSYVHTPTFDIDEEALSISSGLMAWMAIQELNYA
ncbi:MAG: M20 family metallopeptidase [Chryseotalea sp.]